MVTLKYRLGHAAKRWFRKGILHDLIQGWVYWRWLKEGKPVPPTHMVKQMAVKNYARRHGLRSFVETGTFLGEMTYAVKDTFDQIYTIELSQELYDKAVRRFAKYAHIKPVQGDSAVKLPEVLKEIDQPCLFWLDGHYCAGFSEKAEQETPIAEEIEAVLAHPAKGHVILIDDARCFTGEADYPVLQDFCDALLKDHPDCHIDVADDIIRIETVRLPF